MKFIISNYISSQTTEPYYLNSSINMVNGYSSILWDRTKNSLYDIFDYYNPDVFICEASSIPSDILTYAKESNCPELVINITKLSHSEVKNIENILIEHKLKVPFFFTNSFEKIKGFKRNVLNLPLGADVFINTTPSLSYNIDTCFFIDSKDQINLNNEKSCHYISNKTNIEEADMFIPIIQMGSLYKNYENIVIKYFDGVIPQIFFDSVYYGKNVSFSIDNSDKQNTVNNVLNKLLKIEQDAIVDLKEKVQTKHTCLSRTKTLLSQFSNQEGLNEIDSIIEKYRKAN
jgi:hypothetical protein